MIYRYLAQLLGKGRKDICLKTKGVGFFNACKENNGEQVNTKKYFNTCAGL